MADKAKRNKATSPQRNKSAGGKGTPKKPAKKASASKSAAKRSSRKVEPVSTPTEDTSREEKDAPAKLPARIQREGTRRHHSRELTPAESKRRQERAAERREKEVEEQKAHRKNLREQGKGWGGRRAARSAQRGR